MSEFTQDDLAYLSSRWKRSLAIHERLSQAEDMIIRCRYELHSVNEDIFGLLMCKKNGDLCEEYQYKLQKFKDAQARKQNDPQKEG